MNKPSPLPRALLPSVPPSLLPSFPPSLRPSVFLILVVAFALPLNAAAPNYDDHVKGVFRQHCLNCHNADKRKGDLALDTYAGAMTGGSSGEVIFGGDLDSSRLWALVSHEESPKMPPEQDRLPDDQLAVIRKWIEGGALENSGSQVVARPMSSVPVAQRTRGSHKPAGAPAMPENVLRQPVVYTARPAAAAALAASPWAPLVAVGGQRQVALYHSESGGLLGILPFPDGVPHVLQFSRDGSLLLAAGGHAAQHGWAALYDVRSGRQVTRVGDELDAVLAADVIEDHSQIALGGPSRLVQIFSTRDGKRQHSIRKHTDWVYAIAYSPDGVLLASADRSGGVWVWESDTAEQYLQLGGHKEAVTALAWRADSNLLASASEDGTVKLWEMNNGRQVKSWAAHRGGCLSIQFAPDGRLVTAGRDKQVRLWEGDGKQLRAFPAMNDIAMAAAVGHDGRRLIGGDWSGHVQTWSADEGKPLATLAANPPTLEMVAQRTEQQARQLEERTAAAAGELDALEKQVASLKDRHAAVRRQLAAAQTAADQTAAALREMEKSGSTDGDGEAPSPEAQQERQQRLALARSSAGDATKLLEALRGDDRKLQDQRTPLEQQLAAAREAAEAAKQQAAGARAAATAAADELASFRAIPQKLAAAVAQAHERLAATGSDVKRLESERSAAEKAADDKKAAVDQLASQIAGLQQQLDQLKQAQAQGQAELAKRREAEEQARAAASVAAAQAARAQAEQQAFHELYPSKPSNPP